MSLPKISHPFALSPDGRYLAAIWDQALALVSVNTGETVTHLDDIIGEEITALAFSPDGRRLAIGSDKGDVDIMWVL
ncbi:MAG TPA: WD40 repeat domain-containing protein, partial [Symbiobacteriaceae bacterium]|nr:WD40 repeat domain-containing protein [Symbiobacteriaceae bacterium]